ncbi:MAG: class I SAM-dependent methyltransferase, partial [Pseudomonadota bacterium]
FHFWHGKHSAGGFLNSDFEDFDELLKLLPPGAESRNFIETGAGLSTLWFLANEFRVVSFTLEKIADAVNGYLRDGYPELAGQWTCFTGKSERNLVPFTNGEKQDAFDIALIDGNHAIATVFADYVGLNLCLKKGGLLIVDDVRLPGPRLLDQLLMQLTDDWEHVWTQERGKWKCYRKTTDADVRIGNCKEFSFYVPPPGQRSLLRRVKTKAGKLLGL